MLQALRCLHNYVQVSPSDVSRTHALTAHAASKSEHILRTLPVKPIPVSKEGLQWLQGVPYEHALPNLFKIRKRPCATCMTAFSQDRQNGVASACTDFHMYIREARECSVITANCKILTVTTSMTFKTE